MKGARSDWAAVVGLLLFGTALMLPAFSLGHIIGHSSNLNVSWGAEFAAELAKGSLWPRWLPGMNDGLGEPTFYFYAPLPFYISAPFFLLVDERMAMVLGVFAILVLSGLACFALLRHYVDTVPAAIAAALYMVLPYHYHVDIWVRAAYGEQAAFIFVPLSCLCALRLDRSWRYAGGLALSYAGLLLSHLPSAILFAPFLVALCLYVTASGGIVVFARAAVAALLAGGLAAAYLLPAYYGREFIHPEFWGVYAPGENAIRLNEPDFFNRMLLVAVIGAAGVLIVVSVTLRQAEAFSRFLPWLVAAFLILFLVSPAASPVWNMSDVLKIVQFSWRLLVLLDVIVAIGIALSLSAAQTRTSSTLILGFVAVAILSASFLQSRTPSHLSIRPIEQEDEFISSRIGAAEYLPACVTIELGLGQWEAMRQAMTRANEASSPSLIRAFYYPFLVSQEGTVGVLCDPETGLVRADADKNIGLRRMMLREEMIGLAISGASALVVIGIGLVPAARRRMVRGQS